MQRLLQHGRLDATGRLPHIHSMNGRRTRFFVIAILFIVASCETPIQSRSFPQQTFQHLTPISLDVANIRIVRLFNPPLKEPHIEHEMPVPPIKAIERWITERILAVGASGQAVITIRDASVIETGLKRAGGIRGTFTTDQSERYDARIEVEIRAADGRGIRTAKARTTSSRSRSISEDATLNERRTLWYELTERVMSDFNRTFEMQIRKHLAPFLK
ncbi:MAG: hypothetical protein CFH10_01841 [Alphaproteobacteria bacterium MarineAlpha4_Bin2]|nr:MAG: hypothetical protein CFH10_01841 [Alphaproteobacteria bacterium MarineAlpha4_Bin2]